MNAISSSRPTPLPPVGSPRVIAALRRNGYEPAGPIWITLFGGGPLGTLPFDSDPPPATDSYVDEAGLEGHDVVEFWFLDTGGRHRQPQFRLREITAWTPPAVAAAFSALQHDRKGPHFDPALCDALVRAARISLTEQGLGLEKALERRFSLAGGLVLSLHDIVERYGDGARDLVLEVLSEGMEAPAPIAAASTGSTKDGSVGFGVLSVPPPPRIVSGKSGNAHSRVN